MALHKTDQRSPITLPNGNNLTEASIGCGVTTDASGNAALPAAGGGIVGVIYGFTGANSSSVIVRTPCDGAVMLQFGGTVTLQSGGTPLKANASGQFVAASSTDVQAGSCIALALDSGASGEWHAGVLFGSAAGMTAVGGIEVVTSGALSATAGTSYTSTTGAVAYTLPNGEFIGQTKAIEEITGATSPAGTLTITTPYASEPSVHVLTAVGQRMEFIWTNANGTAGWHMTGKKRAGRQAVVVGTTVLTGYDLAASYDLSVTGTESSTGTKGIPNGTVPGEVIHADVTTAASTPVGNIAITATTQLGVAATSWAHIEATDTNLTAVWDGASWDALNFVPGSSSAATLS